MAKMNWDKARIDSTSQRHGTFEIVSLAAGPKKKRRIGRKKVKAAGPLSAADAEGAEFWKKYRSAQRAAGKAERDKKAAKAAAKKRRKEARKAAGVQNRAEKVEETKQPPQEPPTQYPVGEFYLVKKEIRRNGREH